MDKECLAKLCDARQTLCEFCEAGECDWCIVNRLIDDAYNELPKKVAPNHPEMFEDGYDEYDYALEDECFREIVPWS